jgi:hypothetical protein
MDERVVNDVAATITGDGATVVDSCAKAGQSTGGRKAPHSSGTALAWTTLYARKGW